MAIKQSFVAFFFLLFEVGIGGAPTRLGRKGGAQEKKFGNRCSRSTISCLSISCLVLDDVAYTAENRIRLSCSVGCSVLCSNLMSDRRAKIGCDSR